MQKSTKNAGMWGGVTKVRITHSAKEKWSGGSRMNDCGDVPSTAAMTTLNMAVSVAVVTLEAAQTVSEVPGRVQINRAPSVRRVVTY